MAGGRGLFDPSKMRGPAAGAGRSAGDAGGGGEAENKPGRGEPNAWSVSELASRIGSALSSGLPARVSVRGEVSGLRDRTHWYFDLKDEDSVVNAVMFAGKARRSSLRPENGQEVVAHGRVEFYAPGGRVSLIVDRIEAVGAGALEARLRALIEELRGLGWLDPARKRRAPAFPRRVAVVTSATGAALQDVIDTMRRRCPAVGLLVVDARVQGDRAAGEVAAAIGALCARRAELGIDAILVTRGGGSMEDLWAFNEREVARAIYESTVPVVAAIGHETDTTLAELVADVRCATPTQAAMLLTPDREALSEQVGSLEAALVGAVRRRLDRAHRELNAIERHPVIARPRRLLEIQGDRVSGLERRIGAGTRAAVARERDRLGSLAFRLERCRPGAAHARRSERVAQLSARLDRAVRGRVRAQRERLAARARELAIASPLSVLDRGYSYTTDARGNAIRSTGQVKGGQRIQTRVADGTFGSVVGRDAPKRGRLRDGGAQLDLFDGSR